MSTALAKIEKIETSQIVTLGNVGLGFDNVDKDDIIIPQLMIAQDLSPQVKKTSSKYIEGLEPGMLFNNISECYYSELTFIPILKFTQWIIWLDRKQFQNKGFRGSFSTEEEAYGRIDELPGNEKEWVLYQKPMRTPSYYALFVPEEGEPETAVLAFGTMKKWGINKRLTTLLNQRCSGGRNIWEFMFKLTVIPDTNGTDHFYSFNFKLIKDKGRPIGTPEDLQTFCESQYHFIKSLNMAESTSQDWQESDDNEQPKEF